MVVGLSSIYLSLFCLFLFVVDIELVWCLIWLGSLVCLLLDLLLFVLILCGLCVVLCFGILFGLCLQFGFVVCLVCVWAWVYFLCLNWIVWGCYGTLGVCFDLLTLVGFVWSFKLLWHASLGFVSFTVCAGFTLASFRGLYLWAIIGFCCLGDCFCVSGCIAIYFGFDLTLF